MAEGFFIQKNSPGGVSSGTAGLESNTVIRSARFAVPASHPATVSAGKRR